MRTQRYNKIRDESRKFFLGWLKTASGEEIVEKQESYHKNLENLHKNLYKLSWYMRGGVSISELHQMPADHLKYLNEIVNDNFEMSKQAGTPIL
jgi:hypothetical protein